MVGGPPGGYSLIINNYLLYQNCSILLYHTYIFQGSKHNQFCFYSVWLP